MRELRAHGAAVEAMALMPGMLASAGADGQLRLWNRQGQPTWLCGFQGALSCLCAVDEDSLLLAGPQVSPTVVSLDYDQAIEHVPMALKQMLPSHRLFEGRGRHTELRRQRRPAKQWHDVEETSQASSPLRPNRSSQLNHTWHGM